MLNSGIGTEIFSLINNEEVRPTSNLIISKCSAYDYLNNSNPNINENCFNLSLQDVRNNIDENTYLGDNEKRELIQKLEEIEELQKSKESKNKKWEIAKGIFKFIVDKGADIAIMFIPQILKAIQS